MTRAKFRVWWFALGATALLAVYVAGCSTMTTPSIMDQQARTSQLSELYAE